MPDRSRKADCFINDHRERSLLAWALLCCLGLWSALAAHFFLGRVYTFDDLGAFHLPTRWFYARCLANGESFDWMPHLFSGFYLSGEGQAGMYHPLHWFLYQFLPFRAAFDLELLLSYPFMLAGMYLFLRFRVKRRDAALVGAAAFTFSGFNLLHFAHVNAIAVVAHIPWLLWAVDVAWHSRDRRRAAAAEALAALVVGSQLLIGYPQYVWFSLLAVAAHVSFLMLRGTREQREHLRGTRWALLARLLCALTLSLMVGAVQLWPTAEALELSGRHDLDETFLSSGSLHPHNVVQLVAPYLFATRVVGQNTHELGLYAGAVPLVLAVWIFLCRRKSPRDAPLAWAVLGFAVLAFVLALGRYGYLYALQSYLPLVGKFRFPCRAIVLVHLALGTIAAMAFADLATAEQRSRKTPWRRLWPLAALVLVAACLPLVAPLLWPTEHLATPLAMLAGPLVFALAAGLVALASRGARWASVGLILLLGVDLGVYGLSYGVGRRAQEPLAFLDGVSAPPSAGTNIVAYDLPDMNAPVRPEGNWLIFHGLRRVDGYAGLPPLRQLDYRQLASLRVAGVSWVRRTDENLDIAGLIDHQDDWLEVPDPLPRVRLVSRAVASRRAADDIKSLPIETAALVESPLDLAPGPPGDVTLVGERPGHIEIAASCPSRQLLVVAESYHPGWRLTVDGRSQSVLRANGDFLGCVLGPGNHRAVFDFRPRGVQYGRLISMAGLGLILSLAAWRCLRGSSDWGKADS